MTGKCAGLVTSVAAKVFIIVLMYYYTFGFILMVLLKIHTLIDNNTRIYDTFNIIYVFG